MIKHSTLIIFLFLLYLLTPKTIFAREYYVSNTGDNGRNGSLDSPFQTIQKCADMVSAGDTCFIRGGTYRETITPSQSGTNGKPITYTSYQGEKVIVSGTEKVSNWTPHAGNIFKANLDWDLGVGRNQVFVNKQMMIEARWPNTGLDVSHPTHAYVQSGSGEIKTQNGTHSQINTIKDTNLPNPPSSLIGSKINIGLGPDIRTSTGDVTGATPDTIVMKGTPWANDPNSSQNSYYTPRSSAHYFLWGKLSLLDSPSEWFIDSGNKTIYLSPSSGVNLQTTSVEIKKRDIAFNLRSKSYIELHDISIFAATIVMDDHSQHNSLSKLDLSYVSHNLNLPSGIFLNLDIEKSYNPANRNWNILNTDLGLVIRGNSNQFLNSQISYSSSNGIYLQGSNHFVANNTIRDINYGARDYGGIFSLGTNHTFTKNTIYNSAGAILFLFSKNTTVNNNRLYNGGLQLYDWGIIYSKHEANGSNIHHNFMYNFKGRTPLSDFFPGCGFYIDSIGHGADKENPIANFTIHHNVIWDVPRGMCLATPINSTKIYNNTIVSDKSVVNHIYAGLQRQFDLINNIFTGSLHFPGAVGEGINQNSNVGSDSNPQFINPTNGNYQIKTTSPAAIGGNGAYATYRGAFNPYQPAWAVGAQAISLTIPGDLNFDGKVDLFDYNLLVSKFGNPYTIFDYNTLVANYGK